VQTEEARNDEHYDHDADDVEDIHAHSERGACDFDMKALRFKQNVRTGTQVP